MSLGWAPTTNLDWNGMTWDFVLKGISIKNARITKCKNLLLEIIESWPHVTFHQISKIVGNLVSMYPVMEQHCQLRSRYLQMIINVKYFP